ncbi:MAG: nodulation protein NfeD [Candidatus Aenigmatarchaeota archaeon]
MRKILISLLCFIFCVIFLSTNLCEENKILSIKFFGTITLGNYELLKEALEYAEKKNICCVLILLDTYGGTLDATLEIIKLIDRSKVQTISFVYPKGSTAWSAGTMILISSDIAAMSPNSVIGSMQPVYGDTPINESKVINAIVAFTKERMKKHGRNESLVEKFVTENLNLNSEEALRLRAIDLIAEDLEDLLNKIGKSNFEVVEYNPSIRVHLLKLFSDPVISSIILLIGIYMLIFGISSPGVFSEIIGVILIALALINLGANINYIAVFLIIFGTILLIYELASPGFGFFGIVGIFCITFGIFLLPSFPSEIYFIERNLAMKDIFLKSLPIVIFISAFFCFVFYKVVSLRNKRPEIGEMVGKIGIAIENIEKNKIGWIKVDNELWKAKSKEKIKKGEKIKIIKKDNEFLIVEKIKKR